MTLNCIDFEYNKQGNEFLHLVCVSLNDKVYWLNDGSQTDEFLEKMNELKGETLVCHSASLAEIPCCIKLGVDVSRYTWLCTETLYKYINHIKFGVSAKEIKTSLIECLNNYGLAENFTSTEEKDKWRNIILTKDVEQYKKDIIKYCASDTDELKELAIRELKELRELTKDGLFFAEFDPWDYFSCLGLKSKQLPKTHQKSHFDIDKFIKSESLNHISVAKMYCESYNADPYIINHLQDWRFIDEIKKMANEVIPNVYDLEGKRKACREDILLKYLFDNVKGAKEWWDKGFHKEGEVKTKTPSGEYSIADDVLNAFSEDYPNFEPLKKFRHLKKMIQTSQGLSKGEDDKKGWYYPNLYSDGLHCHANEHGANTTRFGNKSTAGHIPSWGKSLRSALRPNDMNEIYFSLDFSSQEMWIVGQMSKDKTLLQTYEEKDIYMKMAQGMGLYPKNLPIPTEEQRGEDWFKPYKALRKIIKGVVLGQNYGMASQTFARRNQMSEQDAQGYWNQFARLFANKDQWGKTLQFYFSGNPIKSKETGKVEGYDDGLPIMIGKEQVVTKFNKNIKKYSELQKQLRVILNFPIQCQGAQITRRAIRYCQDRGLHPFLAVHDEVYFKTTADKVEEDVSVARECMINAAMDCINNPIKEYPIKVGNAELYTSDKYTIHEGAEETFEELMTICKKLDEMGPTPPNPYLVVKPKKTNKNKRGKNNESNNEETTNFLEQFTE